MQKELYIKTRTTGFASPAESYVDKRLDLNDLIVSNPKTTFYFEYADDDMFGIQKGNILVVDRAVKPLVNDLIIVIESERLKIKKYDGTQDIWGKITWTLQKL